MTRPWMSLLLCAAVTAACAPSQPAQRPETRQAKGQNNLGAAEVAFDEGVELSEAGKYKEACVKFEESDRLDHAMNTLFNLADCYEKVGRVSSAWEAFSTVANEARQAGKESLKKDAQGRADTLKPRISKLFIVVPPTVSGLAGVVVRRNGEVVDSGLWNQSVPVDSGEQRIVVTAPTKAPWTETISIKETESAKVSVADLEPASMPKQRIGAIAAAGAGVAGVLVGGIFGGLAFSKWGEAVDACGGSKDQATACPSADRAARAREIGAEASTRATVSNIGLLVGGVGLAAAGVLWFTAPSPDEVSASAGPRIGFSVGGAGAGGLGGVVRGTF